MATIKKLSLLLVLLVMQVIVNAQPGADSLLNFIANNKSRAAFYLVKNEGVVCRQNENKVMPLASTVKMLVAVEFAKQAGSNVIDKDSYVALSELDKYYIFNTDGGAHPGWLAFEKKQGHIKEDSVRLIDVARGMIMFSSNANTEYLMDLLGLDNVNNNIQLFGLKVHTVIFPLVSSLFLYQNPHNASEDKIIKAIRKLSEEQYSKTILQIHSALKYDSVLKKKFRPQDLSMKMQQLWSDRLPASTVKNYVQLCSILNQRKYLDAKAYGILAQELEFIMENPGNQKIYKRFGLKNGSTVFVLTEAFYATTQLDDRIEAAYFFNGLTQAENEKLQGWLNDFRIALTQQEKFRNKVRTMIN
ncbi:MAG: serine hydrolase [Chitinophagaceae bacterium]|nr:serine hydrolase [Chitinophagaceae bacterium]